MGNTLYSYVKDLADSLEIGQSIEIDNPGEQLPSFRKYLSDYGKRQSKKFASRLVQDKLTILRVKYSNIYSKEVEK